MLQTAWPQLNVHLKPVLVSLLEGGEAPWASEYLSIGSPGPCAFIKRGRDVDPSSVKEGALGEPS